MDSRVTGVTGSPHLLWMSAGNQALDLANIVSIQMFGISRYISLIFVIFTTYFGMK